MVLSHGPQESGSWAEISGSAPKPTFPPETLPAVETQTNDCICSLQPALLADFHTAAIAILKSLNYLSVSYFLGPCLLPTAGVQLCSLNVCFLSFLINPLFADRICPYWFLPHLAQFSPVLRRYSIHPHARDKVRLPLKASSLFLKQCHLQAEKQVCRFFLDKEKPSSRQAFDTRRIEV